MKIIIATKNQKKAELVKTLFEQTFPEQEITVNNVDARSEVPDTPWEEQTYNGAINRTENLKKQQPDYDYYIGLETGLVERYGELFEEAWCYILSKENKGYLGYSSGYIVDKHTKTKIQKDASTNTKVLQIFDDEKQEFVMYSGDPEIRKVSLANAIKIALAQIT